MIKSCYSADMLSSKPGLVNLFIQADRFKTLIDLYLYPYKGYIEGDPTSLVIPYKSKEDMVWNVTKLSLFSTLVTVVTGDASENAANISVSEVDAMGAIGLSIPSGLDFVLFATRWNTSLDFWRKGLFIYEDISDNERRDFFDQRELRSLALKYREALSSAAKEGYKGLSDAWLSATEGQQLEEAKQLAGVCANVQVVIEQELTLTRNGFEARLELLNEGGSPLVNISVSLRATVFGSPTVDSTYLFVFKESFFEQLNAINGTGVVNANTNAKVTWLVMALSEAAPMFDTKYDIGGTLKYTIDGVEIPLLNT